MRIAACLALSLALCGAASAMPVPVDPENGTAPLIVPGVGLAPEADGVAPMESLVGTLTAAWPYGNAPVPRCKPAWATRLPLPVC